MDIDEVVDCLSQINITNLHKTRHFITRFEQRKDKICPDVSCIDKIIINEKPVSISKQDNTKFKLGYELKDGYDLTIIATIDTKQSIHVKLVTCYIEKSKKRRRTDAS